MSKKPLAAYAASIVLLFPGIASAMGERVQGTITRDKLPTTCPDAKARYAFHAKKSRQTLGDTFDQNHLFLDRIRQWATTQWTPQQVPLKFREILTSFLKPGQHGPESPRITDLIAKAKIEIEDTKTLAKAVANLCKGEEKDEKAMKCADRQDEILRDLDNHLLQELQNLLSAERIDRPQVIRTVLDSVNNYLRIGNDYRKDKCLENKDQKNIDKGIENLTQKPAEILAGIERESTIEFRMVNSLAIRDIAGQAAYAAETGALPVDSLKAWLPEADEALKTYYPIQVRHVAERMEWTLKRIKGATEELLRHDLRTGTTQEQTETNRLMTQYLGRVREELVFYGRETGQWRNSGFPLQEAPTGLLDRFIASQSITDPTVNDQAIADFGAKIENALKWQLAPGNIRNFSSYGLSGGPASAKGATTIYGQTGRPLPPAPALNSGMAPQTPPVLIMRPIPAR